MKMLIPTVKSAVMGLVGMTSILNCNAAEKPNILWILTDDHRFDAVRAFNKMIKGTEMNEQGYIESPNIDRLTKMGTTFINSYCHSPGCAPSRTSMHSGRYPFHSGVYEFEYYNNNAAHCKPTLPEQMVELGYQTFAIGKLGLRMRTIKNGKAVEFKPYQNYIDFKPLRKDGFTDWGNDSFDSIPGFKMEKPLSLEFLVTPGKKFLYISKSLEEQNPGYVGTAAEVLKNYDLLRHYTRTEGKQTPFSSGMLGGVSPQPAGKTRDGYYASIFGDYLKNKDKKFTIGSQTINGIDESKPQFFYIGFDVPHTPVLPPADYRARFRKHTYKVPGIVGNELETMPKQMKSAVEDSYSDHFTDNEKQSMIQDYYAFCAYGDALIGQAVDDFIAYNKAKKKAWVIVYVNGDNGWKLNEHGSVSKFTPWNVDCQLPIVVISSDKKQYPAGKVVRNFTEFVDIAPTILGAGGANLKDKKFSYLDGFNLADVVSGKAPVRDYVIGESHAVTGPRAYIRTKEYVFSMQTRPNKTRGENMNWAMKATYKDLDPGLYDMITDPHETNNLAFDPKYQAIALQIKEKLMNIVMGDNRVEVDWGPGTNVTGTTLFRSNFAPGANDHKLKLKR